MHFFIPSMEMNGVKTYISLNPNLSKEQALEDARQNSPQPAWSTWIGKDE